jgi:hypothetical protein
MNELRRPKPAGKLTPTTGKERKKKQSERQPIPESPAAYPYLWRIYSDFSVNRQPHTNRSGRQLLP